LFCPSLFAPYSREIRRKWNKCPGHIVVGIGSFLAETPIMTNALTALDKGKPRAEPLMVAIAALAFGMFAGTWIIGPSVSGGSYSKERTTTEEPLTYEQMIARPDPFPYRTATPALPQQAATSPAPIVRERMAEADDPWQSQRSRWSRATRMPDRHTAVH
jgi:hypothetical protein